MTTSGPMVFDHVVVAVPDLEDAARSWLETYGLVALPGGRHPSWGTANRIAPLGDCYLELVTVVDRDVAAGSAFGRWVAAMLAGDAPPMGWAARTRDLDADAERLGLAVEDGRRTRPDGSVLSWRLAGVAEASRDPALPFLIAWGPGSPLPGSSEVRHPVGAARLAALEVVCDPARVGGWTGGDVPRVRLVAGEPSGVRRLELAAGTRTLLIP